MRCSQYMGLTQQAQNWLKENVQITPEHICPTCRHRRGGDIVKTQWNMDDHRDPFSAPPLYEYGLKDGSKVREVIQCSPWSSGPMYFLCLETPEGNRLFEWVEDRSVKDQEYDPVSGKFWV